MILLVKRILLKIEKKAISLETQISILINLIKVTKKMIFYYNFESFKFVFNCHLHSNRFVREKCYFFFTEMFSLKEWFEKKLSLVLNFEEILKKGLSDNWSQVRYAASIAARKFVLNICEDDKKRIFPILLPPICLNRYYIAEGVKKYSQETWKLITKRKGIELVERFIDHFCDYYVNEAKSDNHCVREAACYCIYELSQKIDIVILNKKIHKLIDILNFSLKDECWTVRNSACIAIGEFIKKKKEINLISIENFNFIILNLIDEIPLLRSNSAATIGIISHIYKGKYFENSKIKLFEFLKSILSKHFDDLDRNINETKMHSENMTYSCGSLAPKLKKEGKLNLTNNTNNPLVLTWKTDGAIFLAYQLCDMLSIKEQEILIKLLINIAKKENYSKYYQIQCTLWNVLPDIEKNINKEIFNKEKKNFVLIAKNLLKMNIIENNGKKNYINKLCNQAVISFLDKVN